MPIQSFRAENFRCLENIALEADRDYNLVYGPNASGKTSLLEALAFLGRGKSFRGAPGGSLVRHGAKEFLLFGVADSRGREARLGVRYSREGLELRVNGESSGGVASLAEALPLQLIDPDVHDLVNGGPDNRRRYLDWLAFHVEHGFLDTWRRFRRALKQRNAALKSGADLEAWDEEVGLAGQRLGQLREAALTSCRPKLEEYGSRLLGADIRLEYRPGWSGDRSLFEALQASAERDIELGSTQVGPHRGDLALLLDERQARRLVSRGQQKLLACTLVLAATAAVQERSGRRLLLLLDDPAAELDRESLARLTTAVVDLGCQVFATALAPGVLDFPGTPAVFHVEHGRLHRAAGGKNA